MPSATIPDNEAWLIVKRGLYYGPNRQGYTGIRDAAGRYSYEEAKEHENPYPGGSPTTIVKLTDAPEFSPACLEDIARNHLRNQRDAARAEVDRLSTLVFVPGLWRCPKCEFHLLQANFNARDGSVTSRSKPGEKCPNCLSPLWRVSERDAGNEMVRRCEAASAEASSLRTELEAAKNTIAMLTHAMTESAANPGATLEDPVLIDGKPFVHLESGFRIAPVEPTFEQINRALHDLGTPAPKMSKLWLREFYKAMLAARAVVDLEAG